MLGSNYVASNDQCRFLVFGVILLHTGDCTREPQGHVQVKGINFCSGYQIGSAGYCSMDKC